MNGDTSMALDMLEKDLDRYLADDKIPPETKAILQVQRQFLPFIKQFEEDHKKVETMYNAFGYIKWGGLVAGGVLVVDFVTRLISAIAATAH